VADRNCGKITERSLRQKIRCSSTQKKELVLDVLKRNLTE